ncbi:MAG: exosortase [Acidobacteriia bacterium]|nr:exosortase [Terriglobia bacterium]
MANYFSRRVLGRAPAHPSSQHLRFLLWWFVSLAIFFVPLRSFVSLAVSDEQYSYTLAVPLISFFLVWLKKESIFSQKTRYFGTFELSLLTIAASLASLIGAASLLGRSAGLSLDLLALLLSWVAVFASCYGAESLKAAAFPAAFLLLMIPLPGRAMHDIVFFLQQASADATARLFRIIGVPFLRTGFQFSLPGVDIEIAQECSGIRSSASLLVCSLLVGYLFVRTSWRRACFVLIIVPVSILKNAIRIVTLSWLAIHVDPGFLYGSLHHRGGLAFTLPAIGMMGLTLWVLRRSEAIPDEQASVTLENDRGTNG